MVGLSVALLKSRLSRAQTALDDAQGRLRETQAEVRRKDEAVGEAKRALEAAIKEELR